MSLKRKYSPQTPTVIAIKSHCVAASHIVSGFNAQLKKAINTADTEKMKNISDVDFIPI